MQLCTMSHSQSISNVRKQPKLIVDAYANVAFTTFE